MYIIYYYFPPFLRAPNIRFPLYDILSFYPHHILLPFYNNCQATYSFLQSHLSCVSIFLMYTKLYTHL